MFETGFQFSRLFSFRPIESSYVIFEEGGSSVLESILKFTVDSIAVIFLERKKLIVFSSWFVTSWSWTNQNFSKRELNGILKMHLFPRVPYPLFVYNSLL